VSVVIPTRNHARYLGDTLASVFTQSFRDFELIVVDDGSDDGTAELLRSLEEGGQARCLFAEHAGAAAARNLGIGIARGEFIALLDDDDLWPSDKIEWQVAALDGRREAVLVYGFMETIGDQAGEVFPRSDAPEGPVHRRFLERNWIRSPGQALIRAAALRAVDGFDPTLWGADDWDLYLRLSLHGEFAYEPRRALWHRTHSGNASRAVARLYRNSCRVQGRHLRALAPLDRAALWCIGQWAVVRFCVRQWAARHGFRLGPWR
jgi:glycosyltransferase involved in cell wall biosynthesis